MSIITRALAGTAALALLTATPAPTLTAIAAEKPAGHGAHAADGAAASDDGKAVHGATMAGDVAITTPWMRQPPPGAKVAGGYLTLTNEGEQADWLVGGSVPFARRIEIHEMATTNGMMTMKPVEGGLEVSPGATVQLAPGGYHLMMMGLTDAPQNGDRVPVTLEFRNAGAVEVMMQVAPMGAATAPTDHSGHDMKHMAK